MFRSAESVPRAGRSAQLAVALVLFAVPMLCAAKPPGYYGLGEKPTQEQIAAWDIDVRPDGKGLPEGSGTVSEGAEIYQRVCSNCHGTFGEGMNGFPELSGGEGTLTEDRPEKTVGSYWPYASTLWDYVHRAMPYYAPQSLSADEVYAITAYVLNLNNIVPSDFVANQDSLAKVEMPNEDGFIWEDPRPDTDNPRCMKDCRDEVEVVDSAAGKGITPSTTGELDTSKTRQ